MKSKEMNNTPRTNVVTVNLDLSKNPEEISDGVIKVTHKKCFLGSRDPEGTGTIKVDYTISDDIRAKLNIDKKTPLLTLSCMGNKGETVKLNIKKINEIPFTVRFDSSAIIDCIDPDLERFEVCYTITATMDSDNEPTEKSGKIIVKFQRLDSKPKLSLKDKEITYNADKIKNILRIQNSNTHAYARTLLLKHTAVYLEHGSERLNIVEISYENAYPAGPNSKHVPYGVRIDLEDSANPASHIRRIFPKPGYEMNVPICIDFRGINNPVGNSEKYSLVVEYDYWTDDNPGNPQHDHEKIPFTLLRNDERNELRVELQYGKNTVMMKGDYLVPTPIDITANDFSYTFHIRIKNAASVKQSEFPNAGIVISNLEEELKIDEASAFKGKTIVDVSRFVVKRITGKQVESGKVRLLPSESVDIELTVKTGHIDKFISAGGVDVFNAYLHQTIKFNYFIDNTGRDNPSKLQRYEGCTSVELEIPPAPEWMGVDFGTSAVVALYGNSFNLATGRVNNIICNLGAIKIELLRAAYRQTPEFARVRDESVFINSNIVLNDRGDKTENFSFSRVNGQYETDYRQAKVLFSPGDQFAYDKLMPSLKSMMGHKRVPSAQESERDRMPLVDDVYQIAYNQLFDLYLKTISGNRPAEKIVMTFPNTFATMHVQKLKELAKRCMPSLRDDYIVTISESDAIAFKYLRHRNQLVEGIDKAKNADQHILVYDMGAGTLDITYFTNICNDEGVREVDIVGKYGINKAGNYLDYVLAEIVVDLCEKAGHNEIGGTKLREYISYSSTRKTDIGTCFELKKYVKNVLKPCMAEYECGSMVPDDVMMPEWEDRNLNLASIPLKKVFQSSKFNEYIKSVSSDVVKGCRANIENMVVDVVVFSGRMTCFSSIRKAVVDALGAEKLIVVDIAKGQDSSVLKSSVVEGALDYVERFIGDTSEFQMLPKRPLYCNYCVLVKMGNESNESEVHCMINNKTVGLSSTEKVNLSSAQAIYLLQTYASNADAVIKDFDGSRDLTTILVAKDVQRFNGSHDLTVSVKSSKSNRFNQGTNQVSLEFDTGEVNVIPQENLESEAFRKSSWPVVFV